MTSAHVEISQGETLKADRKTYWTNKRVELHPGTDRWMMGDRYGKVVCVTNKALKVKLDKSGLTITLPESRVTVVD